MKAPILTFVALYYIGISSAFADGSHEASDKRGPAGIAVGEPLVAARAKLVKQRWKPTRVHANGYEYSGAERELAARKFFEVDVCSFDSSRCILFYSKNGTCLRVDTIGEQLNDMTVTRWADECPDAPKENGKSGAGSSGL